MESTSLSLTRAEKRILLAAVVIGAPAFYLMLPLANWLVATWLAVLGLI